MLPRQEGLISQMAINQNAKEPDFFERTGATRDAPQKFPGGAGTREKRLNPSPKGNFKEIKAKLEITGRLELEDFNDVSDMGLFLDWYNSMNAAVKQKEFNTMVKEMSVEGEDRIKHDLGMTRRIPTFNL